MLWIAIPRREILHHAEYVGSLLDRRGLLQDVPFHGFGATCGFLFQTVPAVEEGIVGEWLRASRRDYGDELPSSASKRRGAPVRVRTYLEDHLIGAWGKFETLPEI